LLKTLLLHLSPNIVWLTSEEDRMKETTARKQPAFTLLEVCVIIAVLALLAAMLLPALTRAKIGNGCPNCKYNLMQIGMAYRLWIGDGEFPPAQEPSDRGGWLGMLTNANQSSSCWTNFAIMGNELGPSRHSTSRQSSSRNPLA
jgi:hypothetical protein